MIKPKPKPSPVGSRAMAVVVTVALLLGAHVGLKGVAVPAFASGRDAIRELDPLVFERYAAPPPPEETASPEADEEADEEAERAETPDEGAEVASFDEEVGQAMEELERVFGPEETAGPVSDRVTDGDEPAAAGITEEVPDDRFEALFGARDEPVVGGAAARGPARAGAGRGGVGLGITERSTGGAPDPGRGASDGAVPGVDAITSTRRRPAVDSSEVVIGDFAPESFDGSEADRLAGWMRAHPAELPIGVRVHVNYQPSFLTSAAAFTSEGREWELFLMFNATLRELHIVMVEGGRSIYMIDRGFQEESRSLREGTVRRSQGEIVAVDSRTVSASGERARDFYDVFLSWWKAVSDDADS